MFDHCRNNPTINQRFSTEQPRFARTRVVRRPPYEIKACCDARRTTSGTEIANISTDI